MDRFIRPEYKDRGVKIFVPTYAVTELFNSLILFNRIAILGLEATQHLALHGTGLIPVTSILGLCAIFKKKSPGM
jgi:hypothetical protein